MLNNIKKYLLIFCYFYFFAVTNGVAEERKKYIGVAFAFDFNAALRLGYRFNRHSSLEGSLYKGDDFALKAGARHHHQGVTLAYRHNLLFFNDDKTNFFLLGGVIADEATEWYQHTKTQAIRLDWGIGFHHKLSDQFDITMGIGLSGHGIGINYSF